MTASLSGSTALVTGGGVGIGRGIALALAEAGARIVLTHRTHRPEPGFLRELETISGAAPLSLPLDATSEPEVAGFAEALRTEVGSVEVLVNNVGGLLQRSSIADMPFELWRSVMAVNLDSTFLMTHHVLPLMTRASGRIVNVASLAGRNGGHAGATAYAASKAAIFGFTRGLAKEVAPRGITVNALAPGFIEATPFHDTFTTADSKAATVEGIPVGRAGVPADVASAVVWLASPSASFVSGAIVDINGAQYFG